MRLAWLAVALTFVLVVPSASAGGGKAPKANAARKAETAKKRSTRVRPSRTADCDRVIFDDVPMEKLRLVGIVGQGRMQKALLMDAADEAGTLMRGDCVGVERVHYDDVVRPLLGR